MVRKATTNRAKRARAVAVVAQLGSRPGIPAAPPGRRSAGALWWSSWARPAAVAPGPWRVAQRSTRRGAALLPSRHCCTWTRAGPRWSRPPSTGTAPLDPIRRLGPGGRRGPLRHRPLGAGRADQGPGVHDLGAPLRDGGAVAGHAGGRRRGLSAQNAEYAAAALARDRAPGHPRLRLPTQLRWPRPQPTMHRVVGGRSSPAVRRERRPVRRRSRRPAEAVGDVPRSRGGDRGQDAARSVLRPAREA